MTVKNVFVFDEYKAYLGHRLEVKGARSGLRAALAKAIGSQNSFVSQVLHADAHLSLEQACRANPFFEHDSQESHFFLLLIQRDRAGTRELTEYFSQQISEILLQREKIQSRVNRTHQMSEEFLARYYSHWDFIAVHMALAVPQLRTAKALSSSLNLPRERVEVILDLLTQSGLAYSDGGEFRIGDIHLHLNADSPFIQQHHNNWRIEAMRKLQSPTPEQVHYSGVFSLSQKDFNLLRENLLEVIQKNMAVVRPSPEEIIVCQTIDLFPLTRKA